jgi:hypothetical protein
MSVKITLEFDTVEESIVALGKLVGIKARGVKLASQDSAAPVKSPDEGDKPQPAGVVTAPAAAEPAKPPRKPRADRGQPREPYGPRNPEANAGAASAPAGTPAPATPATVSAASAAAPQAVAPVAASVPHTAAPASTSPAHQTAHTATPAPAAAVPTQEDVQKAVEKLFNAKGYDVTHDLLSRFGVKRGKDLAETQRADFIRRAEGVIAGEAV